MKPPFVWNRRHFNACAASVAALGLSLAPLLALANPAAAASSGTPAAAGNATGPKLLVLGDSLSAEFGLRRGSGWVALLQRRLASEGRSIQVFNASIGGETTAGGRARLPALLRTHQPAVVVVALGANDALRGLPLTQSSDNLRAIARESRAAGARVLLLGIDVPPNFGERFRQDFRRLFTDIAQAEQAALMLFMLEGVADRADPTELFQSDGIHPNEAAQPIILEQVWPYLRPLLPRG
ncbi:arylesterase [Serpentinimonas barnesii]|uniref:arylesterase n=1 Tax=Serpentinimonas barnesii TaxID=1458427 RepID=UPI000495E6BF|nr:arylesterase [Serpentinimonas barnesii]